MTLIFGQHRLLLGHPLLGARQLRRKLRMLRLRLRQPPLRAPHSSHGAVISSLFGIEVLPRQNIGFEQLFSALIISQLSGPDRPGSAPDRL